MGISLFSILSIAGSDNSGGAGIQADIKAISSLGCHAMTAVTAITSQSFKGLADCFPVPSGVLKSQLFSILDNTFPDAIKIGMLGSLNNAEIIANFIKSIPVFTPVIVDPVFKISAGGNLLDVSILNSQIFKAYRKILENSFSILTPNIPEFLFFIKEAGLEKMDHHDENEKETILVELAKQIIRQLNCKAIILKGGHSYNSMLTDILIWNKDGDFIIKKNCHNKVNCRNLHGTGCVFSSLLASYLAKGYNLIKAFEETSSSMNKIINRSSNYKLGVSEYGPLNIFDFSFNIN